MKRFIAIVALLAASCGNGNNDSRNVIPGNNPVADMGSPDQAAPDDASSSVDVGVDEGRPDLAVAPDMPADMTTDLCGGAVCDAGFVCVNNACVPGDSCLTAYDLGMLADGVESTVSGSLITDGADDLEATCVGATSLRDRVISFEVGFNATLDYSVTWQGQYDGVVELRGDCADAGSTLDCSDMETRSVSVSPGTYYLVLDQKLGNAGDFEVKITASAAACVAGTRECAGDLLRFCADPQAPTFLVCADGCAAGACAGDSCADAILVTAGATYAGDGAAYQSTLDFMGNATCRAADNQPIETPGFEVVFYLPGLTANQVVTIDAETNDTNINAIFILPSCGDTGACAAAYKAEAPDWVVPADGNYYIIIDKRQATNNMFQYAIDIL